MVEMKWRFMLYIGLFGAWATGYYTALIATNNYGGYVGTIVSAIIYVLAMSIWEAKNWPKGTK
jgi:hypothetical protein